LPNDPHRTVATVWGPATPSIPDLCEADFSHEIADPVPARAAGFTATCCPASRAGPEDARHARQVGRLGWRSAFGRSGKGEAHERSAGRGDAIPPGVAAFAVERQGRGGSGEG